MLCQGPSAEKWQDWDGNQQLSASPDGQFHSAMLSSPSTGSPVLLFFLPNVRGSHPNKHGRKTGWASSVPTKPEGPAHSSKPRRGRG